MGPFPHGGCGPNCAACSAGEETWKRSASWAKQIAGKTKRNAEIVSTSRKLDRQFLVRMMTVAASIQCSSFCAVTKTEHQTAPRIEQSLGKKQPQG
jgi:hypothetical protein